MFFASRPAFSFLLAATNASKNDSAVLRYGDMVKEAVS
jgi:hypothetical protein